MTQYILEDNIDFFAELNKTNSNNNIIIDTNNDNDNNVIHNDNDNALEKCLISNKPLDKNHIKLQCNHTFNFIPLYLEIKQQKTIKNFNEIVLLKKNQLKCPYCRNIQSKLLPYYNNHNESLESGIVEKLPGVNIPKKDCMWLHKCSGVFKGGPNKGMRCNKPCNDFMCSQHIKQLDKNNNTTITAAANRNNQTCNKCNATNLNGKKCKQTGKNCVTISVDGIEYKKYLCTTHNNKYLKFKDSWDNYDLKIYFT